MSTSILKQFAGQQPQLPDDQLLSEARSGDQQAFAELCLRYRGMVMHRIFSIVRHQEDAEDVLQETLLKAYLNLSAFRGACSFSTWLMAIGTNMSLMLLRRRKGLREYSGDVVMENGEMLVMEFRDPSPNPEQHCMMSQTSQQLKLAVRRLTPQVRNLLEIYYKNDLHLKDAAQILGIPETTAKSRIWRARRMLRRSLRLNQCWTP